MTVDSRFDSVWVKSAVIAAMTLLMLWPLARVESLVNERQARQHEASDVISAGFGGPQILGAPILKVDTQERSVTVDKATKITTEEWSAGAPLFLVPHNVEITNHMVVEIRRKGIYSVPVYLSKVVMTGEFAPDAIATLLAASADTRVLPSTAVFELPVSGAKYLRSLTRFEVGGRPLHATIGEVAGFAALSAPVDLTSMDRTGVLRFTVSSKWREVTRCVSCPSRPPRA